MTNRQTAEDFLSFSTLESYNVFGGMNGLGSDIYLHILHETVDPQDIVQFVSTSKNISRTLAHKQLIWAETPVASRMYSLKTIPSEKVVLVCSVFLHTNLCLIIIYRMNFLNGIIKT